VLYGYCLGGGLELPLACHFRLAAGEGCKIGLPELDLGTVPAELRRTLAAHGVLSYRVLLFERDAAGDFKPPDAYPSAALVTASTHDLPTLAGWWVGHDIALLAGLGRPSGRSGRARDRRARRTKASCWSRFRARWTADRSRRGDDVGARACGAMLSRGARHRCSSYSSRTCSAHASR
jgi:4-alpha-glucanotransferase